MKVTPTTKVRLQYKKVLEMCLIASLLFHIFVMQGFKKVKEKSSQRSMTLSQFDVEEIPQTQQEKLAPAPSRPTVPIASEDEDLPDDETIDDTILDLQADAPPPPAPPEDGIVFVPYDEPPTPIGGYDAIHKNLVYPDIARKAGVEGKVLVYAQVDEKGNVVGTRIVKSLGPNGCDEAASSAIRRVKWKPAMQRDTPVKVWIMVPIEFKLRGG